MKYLRYFNKLAKNRTVLFPFIILFSLSACSTMESMSRVSKNIEEGRLVPAEAVDVPDVLNQYSYDYPSPRSEELGIHIDMDRPKVMISGSDAYAQIALVTHRPKPQPVQLHLLVYDESPTAKKHQDFIKQFLDITQKQISTYAKASLLTVDTAFSRETELKHYQALNQSKKALALKAFLSRYALMPVAGNGHQFILLVGDNDNLTDKDKQDMIDMARIFTSRGVKLSVMSYGEKPDFAFYTQLAEKGDGQLGVDTSLFDMDSWIKSQIELVHAYALKNVIFRIQALNGVRIEKVISPSQLSVTNNYIDIELDKILAGQQYVAMLKLKVPQFSNKPELSILSVSGSYYSQRTDRFHKANIVQSMLYTNDLNAAQPYKSGKVFRSNLILKTRDTIIDASHYIRYNRNYQAIAMLIRQQTALQMYLNKQHDLELSRDLKILEMYAHNLQKFDDSWFQQWKIWKDMSWDKARFNQSYQ